LLFGCTTYWSCTDTDHHVVGLVKVCCTWADLHTKWLAIATLDACTWNGCPYPALQSWCRHSCS
jgi:hypothetical protein